MKGMNLLVTCLCVLALTSVGFAVATPNAQADPGDDDPIIPEPNGAPNADMVKVADFRFTDPGDDDPIIPEPSPYPANDAELLPADYFELHELLNRRLRRLFY